MSVHTTSTRPGRRSALRRRTIAPYDWTVLLVVAQTGPAPILQLERHILLDPGTAQPHLDRLLEHDLITATTGGEPLFQVTPCGLDVLGDVHDLDHLREHSCFTAA